MDCYSIHPLHISLIFMLLSCRLHSIVFPSQRDPLSRNWLAANYTVSHKQEGQHPLTGQRAANFRLLANQ